MRIAIYTLGCKLNQAESDELKENLQKEGFFIVNWKSKADIYVINACSLTAGAEQGTRQIIRQARRKNPKAKIFVTGCFGQNLPEVDFCIKNQHDLIKKIKVISRTLECGACSALGARQASHSITQPSKTRAFIKIQTGCDNFCSYCIIPYFRGKPKSIPDTTIIDAINKKVAQGFKEVVLTGVNICKYGTDNNNGDDSNTLHFGTTVTKCNNGGVNICKYGTDNNNGDDSNTLHFGTTVTKCKIIPALIPGTVTKYKVIPAPALIPTSLNLTGLIKKILNETNVQRIRLGSLDPSLVDENFIALFHNPRVMPHMHLSLQSGSNRILKLMNRKYTAQKYLSLIKKIKKQFPFMGFTTDVIVGFPDETEKDFQDTCNLVKKVGFLKVHIFPYSSRPGTPAKNLPHQIDEKTKKDRVRRLFKIANTVRDRFIKKMIGQTVSVLFEEKRGSTWFGYTPNYLRIKLNSRKNLKNKILNVTLNWQNFR